MTAVPLASRQTIQDDGISDANLFFTTLLSKPYLNNVVIAPHYYGPSISEQTVKCGAAPGACCGVTRQLGHLLARPARRRALCLHWQEAGYKRDEEVSTSEAI